MSNGSEQANTYHSYRVEGFTCANCAGKFERNVKEIEGVQDAKVNFGASKISVAGSVTIAQLEQAGAFESLKITADEPARSRSAAATSNEAKEKPSFWQTYHLLLYSVLLIVLGYLSYGINGEQNLVTILLFLAATMISGAKLLKIGLQNLLRLDFDMRTLMTVAVIGGAIIGEWAEIAVVVILFAVSEALERYSMNRARQSIRQLMDIAPKEALIRRGNQEQMVAVEEIRIGDIMLVKPGQKIAMDGVVVQGQSAVNQAAITGESIPAAKGVGDEVFAGTLNGEGWIEVEITKHVEDTTIARIIHLVEEAQAERAPAQAFIDKFAKVYTPAIMLVAALVAVLPPLLLDGAWSTWVYQGLAVLVVGCPCALVISTPISIVSAIGNAAKQGVLIKGGIYLEEMGSVKAVAFDKTGTLTEGVPSVTDYEVLEEADADQLLAIIAALEHRSQHPLASAIVNKAHEEDVDDSAVKVEGFTAITGKGISGSVQGTTFYVGSPRLFTEELAIRLPQSLQQRIDELQQQGKTIMLAGMVNRVLALIAVADKLRSSSRKVLQELQALGIKQTVMLTGDAHSTAQYIGREAGVTNIEAELMPEEKLQRVKQLQERYGKVAMVGDGVNDAPALAASSVGIAMGGAGTDTALETADIALMADDLSKLPFTVKLSRKAMQIIKINIAFSIGIKLIALLLVIPGWLTLWIAITADIGATLAVSLNSMRLMRMKQ